jgi:hypothetical protein
MPNHRPDKDDTRIKAASEEKQSGSVKSSASIRGGGIESRGKTKGRFV